MDTIAIRPLTFPHAAGSATGNNDGFDVLDQPLTRPYTRAARLTVSTSVRGKMTGTKEVSAPAEVVVQVYDLAGTLVSRRAAWVPVIASLSGRTWSAEVTLLVDVPDVVPAGESVVRRVRVTVVKRTQVDGVLACPAGTSALNNTQVAWDGVPQ